MLQIASLRMKEALASTLPRQDLKKGDKDFHEDSINPLNESQGPNFFLLASSRLREIGFKFST